MYTSVSSVGEPPSSFHSSRTLFSPSTVGSNLMISGGRNTLDGDRFGILDVRSRRGGVLGDQRECVQARFSSDDFNAGPGEINDGDNLLGAIVVARRQLYRLSAVEFPDQPDFVRADRHGVEVVDNRGRNLRDGDRVGLPDFSPGRGGVHGVQRECGLDRLQVVERVAGLGGIEGDRLPAFR